MLCRLRFLAIAASAIGLAVVCLPALFFTRAEILPVKTYTAADGLPRDAVWKVRQDARGFLWFCTADGLVRFDGYGFKLYSEDEGLPSRRVNDFLQARNGDYWIGTTAGLLRFNPNGVLGKQANPAQAMFAEVGYEAPPPTRFAKEVKQIYEDPQGALWIGMEDGLYQLIEKQGQPILRRIELPFQNKLGYLPIRSVLKDRRGNLWVGTENGPLHNYHTLYRIWPDGKINQQNILNGIVNAMLETKNGEIFVGLNRGLCLLAEDVHENSEPFSHCYSQKDGLPNLWVTTLHQTSDDTIWIGTVAGAARFSPEFTVNHSRFQFYGGAEGVCDVKVTNINADRDGNLWFSTDCGATKFVRNGFVRYSKADGLGGMSVHSIFADRANNFIVITNDRRDMLLNVFDGQRFTFIKANTPPKTVYGWGWGQIIVNSRAGDWWFPTEEGILYRFRGITDIQQLARAKPQAYTAKEGFTDRMVWQMYADARGDLWIGTSYQDKLLRWDQQTETFSQLSSNRDEPVPLLRPNAFAEEANGTLWLGGGIPRQAALARYRQGTFKVFTAEDLGFPPGKDDKLDALLLDHKNRLWFTTSANGVGRIDDLNSEPLQVAWHNRGNGLTTNRGESLVEDRYGRIYIGTMRGVDCLTPETGLVRSFTTADGLPKEHIYVSARDAQGALWFGSPQGVARFVPESPRPNQPPTIFLSGLRIAGEARPVSEIGELTLPPLELSSSQTNVSIDFLSPSATSDPHIRYQYKLEGRADWSAPTEQRSVDFANLSAGSYRFLARAMNADGIVSATPASVSFTVAAPVWRRWWFIALSLVTIGGLAFAAYRYRVAQLLAMERMRTRIATDLHDEVGSSLSQIAILSEVARQNLRREEKAASVETAAEPMEKVATTSREAIDAMSDIVWAINPQRDQLSDLTQRMRRFASDTLTARDIELRFHAPEQDLSLDAEVRRQVFLIFKEAINNIVRHANATEVEVDFTLTDHRLSLRVWDNGRGFAETQPEPGRNGGNGLSSMKRRAAELGGRLEVISGSGDGAIIKLEAPLRSRKVL